MRSIELNFKNVFSAAASGDPLAIQVRDSSLEGWSAGIFNFIYAFDPERLIMGGGHYAEQGSKYP